jgi:putative ABC transport system permease protein
MVILTSLQKPYEELQIETKAPTSKFYPFAKDNQRIGEWKESLERLKTISQSTILKRHIVTEKMKYKGKEIEAFLSLVEYQQDVYGEVRLLDNKVEQPGKGECFIPAVLANEFGIKKGDQLTLLDGDMEYKYTIAGIYVDPYALSLSYNLEVLVDRIPEELRFENFLALYSEEGASGEDMILEYLDSKEGILDGRFYTVEEGMSNSSITEKILGGILLALSIIVFFVSSLMIRYMIKNALLQENKTIAIYKSIGYGNGDILRIYLTFYLFLTMTGSILGILMSTFLSGGFMKKAFSNIGEINSPELMLPGLICFLIINTVAFLQIYLVLSKLKQYRPVIALSGREYHLGLCKTKNFGWMEGLSFSPLGMAIRTIRRDKKNTIYMILTCIVSIYMVNFALLCFSNIDSMQKDNYYWIGFDQHEVSLTAINPKNFDEDCSKLRDDPRVERLIKNNFEVGVMIPWQKGMGYAIVYESYENLNMPLVRGRNPKYSDEIVVSNLVAQDLKKEIGDYMEVYLKEGKRVSFLIVGTYQSFYNMGRGVRLLGSAFTENDVALEYNEASIYLKPGTDRNEFIQSYEERFYDRMKIVKREDKFENIISNITEPQKMAIGPFMALVLFIGGLNLMYIVFLKNSNQRKTYSIYKSIGYHPRHLVKMNLWYIGMVAVVSMIITVPIFLSVFPKMMVLAMAAFGFEKYLVSYNVITLLIGNIGIILVFLFSVYLSSRNLYGNDISELGQE